jgi:DNA invertase Pin-like site-specific DNA recombinase
MKVAYLRVSTTDQNLDRQKMLIADLGVEQIFEEKLSGKNTNRPALKAMLDFVRSGDTLVIESISRLARSTRDLLNIVETLQKKNVSLVSLKENFDTSTPNGKFMLTIFGALAELERETTLQRQREGIDAAKLQGKHLGRPGLKKPDNWDSVMRKWRAKEIKTVDAIKETGMAKASFYKMVAAQR